MKNANLPSSLPMLPGNVYADPTVTRYHKTQLLGIKDNTICGKSKLQTWQLGGPVFKFWSAASIYFL